MTETLLWQTLEDCFRRSDLTGIAALADEVALTDEALAATLRWIGGKWWCWIVGEFEDGKGWHFTGKSTSYTRVHHSKTFLGLIQQVHQYRLSQLEFFQ